MTSSSETLPGWSPDDLRVADDLVLSRLGREAAEAGWVMPLWDFCRREHRLPEPSEIPDIKRKGAILDQAIEACGSGSSAWGRLGASMQMRRQAMADRVLSWGEA